MATNEPEWRDVNPVKDSMPGRGRTVIHFIAGGIALIILTIVSARIRPVGLVIGIFTFMSGLTMLIRRKKFNFKPGIIVTICGFFLLLANPRFGVVAGFAGFFLIIGAIGLVVFGLFRAIKLAWELGKFT